MSIWLVITQPHQHAAQQGTCPEDVEDQLDLLS